MKIEYKLSTP